MGVEHMYSIGRLAKLNNITVRTLRYYDEVGLLNPTKVSESGHRYYDSQAALKLQNIIMLKEIGFELETIHEILANQVKSTKELLHMRLQIIKVKKEELEESEEKILGILRLMEVKDTNDWEPIFNTFLKPISNQKVFNEIRKNYFTVEELEIIEKLPRMGSDDKLAVKWVELIKDIRFNLHKDPASVEAQTLVSRWLNLVDIMFHGNWDLAQKTWNINWNKEEELGFYKFDSEIIHFMGKAQKYYFEQKRAGESDE